MIIPVTGQNWAELGRKMSLIWADLSRELATLPSSPVCPVGFVVIHTRAQTHEGLPENALGRWATGQPYLKTADFCPVTAQLCPVTQQQRRLS